MSRVETKPDVDLEAMLAMPLPPCRFAIAAERDGRLDGKCEHPPVTLVRFNCRGCGLTAQVAICESHLAWLRRQRFVTCLTCHHPLAVSS